MVLVAALGSQMQNIRRIGHGALRPISDIFSKTTPNLGVIAHHVVLPERFQTRSGPISHGYHDRFLVHLELARFREMQASFPCIAEPIRPFSRITVSLMPNIFFRPKPSLLSKCKNQFQDIGMALPVFCLFLDVEHKRTGRFEYAKKLGTPRQEPVHIILGSDAAISAAAAVSIGR